MVRAGARPVVAVEPQNPWVSEAWGSSSTIRTLPPRFASIPPRWKHVDDFAEKPFRFATAIVIMGTSHDHFRSSPPADLRRDSRGISPAPPRGSTAAFPGNLSVELDQPSS